MLTQLLKAPGLIRIGVCALALVATPAAASAGPYDGSWNVKIVTQHGECDSGASLPIRVNNGTIASDLPVVKVTGRVAADGNVSVSVGNGIEHATGNGHLSENGGTGTWRGGPCSGIWTASKS